MVCPKCGNNNVDNSSFCANCGNALNSVQGGTLDNSIVNTSVPSNNDVNNSVPFVHNTISNPQSIPGGSFTSNPSLNQDSVSLPTSNPSPKKFNIMIPIGVGVVFIAVAAMIGLNVFSKPDETRTNNNSSGVSGVSEKQSSSDDNISIFDIPIPVKKDGKYGYIDSGGSFLIEPQYKEAFSFYGNYARVVKKEDGTKYYVIDKKGNIKLTGSSKNSIIHDDKYDVWVVDNVLYDSSLNKISSDDIKVFHSYSGNGYYSWVNENNSTAGIINMNGEITYTYKFESGESDFDVETSSVAYPIKEKYCLVSIGDTKNGIVNCDTGKVAYDFTDKDIECLQDNTFEIKDSFNISSIIYIQNDQVCLETNSSSARIIYNGKGYVVLDDYMSDDISLVDIITGEKYSEAINKTNEAIIYWTEWQEFTKAIEFSNGMYVGMKTTGKEIIPGEFDRFQYFDIKLQKILSEYGKNYVLASKNNMQYLVDLKDGNTIAEFHSTSDSMVPKHASTFIYFEDDTGEWTIYNIITGNTKIVSEFNFDCSALNYCIIKENNKSNYYNINFELIYSEEL